MQHVMVYFRDFMVMRSQVTDEDLREWHDLTIECGQQRDGHSCGPFIMMVGFNVFNITIITKLYMVTAVPTKSR